MRGRANQRSGQQKCCCCDSNRRVGWSCATEISMIVSMFLSMFLSHVSIALWASLTLGNASTMEVNTDWKSMRNFTFMDKDRWKLKPNCKHCLKKNLYKFLTWNIFYNLLLGVFAIKRSVLGNNVNVYTTPYSCHISCAQDIPFVISEFQRIARKIFDRCKNNHIKANPGKCHVILSPNKQREIRFDSTLIASSLSQKLLGITTLPRTKIWRAYQYNLQYS